MTVSTRLRIGTSSSTLLEMSPSTILTPKVSSWLIFAERSGLLVSLGLRISAVVLTPALANSCVILLPM